jgi:hypothetical protein
VIHLHQARPLEESFLLCIKTGDKKMATRSTIGIKLEDGTVQAIYCHWDGYPAGVGVGLVQNYSSKEQAQALINLGGFSGLMETLEETKAGAYGTPSDSARTFTSEKDWLKNFNSGEEYFYLYTDLGWVYSQGGNWYGIKTESEVA